MKNSMLMATILLAFFVTLHGLSAVAAGGGGAGNTGGGDPCEKRIQEIRTKVTDWIDLGGARTEHGLKLPLGVTPDGYASAMKTYLRVDEVGGIQVPTTAIECIHQPVELEGCGLDIEPSLSPNAQKFQKTCKFEKYSADVNGPKIQCYSEAFMNPAITSDMDQVQLIHHEYAGLAGIEVPNKCQSDYRVSSQLSDRMQWRQVLMIALDPQVKEERLTPSGPRPDPFSVFFSGKCEKQDYDAMFLKLAKAYVAATESATSKYSIQETKVAARLSEKHVVNDGGIKTWMLTGDMDIEYTTAKGTILGLQFRTSDPYRKILAERLGYRITATDYLDETTDSEGNVLNQTSYCQVRPNAYVDLINLKYHTIIERAFDRNLDSLFSY